MDDDLEELWRDYEMQLTQAYQGQTHDTRWWWFFKNTQISNVKKIHLEGAELFHADQPADMTKIIVTSHNCAPAPKNGFPDITK